MCVIDHGRIAVLGTPDELKHQLLDRAICSTPIDRPALVAELRGARPRPGRTTRPALLRVAFEAATAQDLIARIRTPLSVLRVHEPSLEEAYVELLRQPEEAVA